MMYEIIEWPHKILNTKSKPIDIFDETLQEFVIEMFETMVEYNGIGLAANQVGTNKRVIVIDNKDVGGTLTTEIINPVIIGSKEVEKNKEGCLSFPKVYVTVERHKHITVTYQDMTGKEHTKELSGIDSICVQHELDHVNGITFYDRLGPVAKKLNANKFNKLKKRKHKNGK